MRKLTKLFLVGGGLLCALLTAPLISGAETKTENAKAVGTLLVKYGMVDVLRQGETNWIKAEKGMLIFEGDRIKTRELARAAVILDDGSVTRLNENTDLILSVKDPEKKKSRVKLLLGKLWAKITKQDSDLEIETPSAVAAIKGTEFELWVSQNGNTQLLVWDGMVNFFNDRGKVLVRASQQSTALPNQAPHEPKTIDLKKLDQWFATVIEVPNAKSIKLTIKDKAGQEQKLNLKYQKK